MATATVERGVNAAPALSVITAKICPELLPAHAVRRPRLLELLTRDDWRMASITAGPGVGKSVLLLQWLETLGADDQAVVVLDEADNAPERFWRYVVATLARARPGAFERSAGAYRSGCGSETLIGQILEDAAALNGVLVLAIEDLHTVRNTSILDAVARFFEHLPPQLRVVFTSRQDVALPIARWRARSWLVDIRGADLAFTEEETRQLFDALGERRLDATEIEQLTTVTEGWVAALQLAAVAMRDTDPHDVVSGFCGRSPMIADFLGSEIIDRQPDDVRDFMTAVAVADSFDSDLCTKLTGRRDSADLLWRLASTTHFLVAVDDARSSYRYHHLLREVLRADLARRNPERWERLHRLVADAYEGRGEIAATAVHLVAAGDYDRAFDLVFDSTFALWERDDIDTVRSKLDVFPIDYICASPHRMLVFALALVLSRRFDEGREWLDRAQRAIECDPGSSPGDLGLLEALRLLAFNVDGRGDGCIECGQRALARVEAGADIGPLGSHLREHLTRAHLLADDVDEARATLNASRDGAATSQVVLGHGLAARIAYREGSLNTAADRAERACTAAAAFGVPSHFVTIDAHLAAAGVLIDRNEIAAAAAPIETIHEILQRDPSFTYQVLTGLEEGRVAMAREGSDAALELVSELRSLVDASDRPHLRRRVAALEARLRIEADEPGRARLLVDRVPQHWPARRLLEARLLLASGRPLEACEAIGQFGFTNVRDCTEAQLLVVRGSLMAGTDVEPELRRLVDLAAPERFIRLVLDEGSVITRLIRQSAETSGGVEAERLAVELGAPRRRARLSSELVDPLSERERDVLRYLPSRLTTKEIAAECFMSTNTVKAHLKRIYRKLGVCTRAEAVERAVLVGELRG
jgi:LuxR family maltose regulon positive regulatory protein